MPVQGNMYIPDVKEGCQLSQNCIKIQRQEKRKGKAYTAMRGGWQELEHQIWGGVIHVRTIAGNAGPMKGRKLEMNKMGVWQTGA